MQRTLLPTEPQFWNPGFIWNWFAKSRSINQEIVEELKELVVSVVRSGKEIPSRPRLSLHLIDLSRAKLEGATLPGVNLLGANLTLTNLNNATLTGASLFSADLTKTFLKRADLTKADLSAIGYGYRREKWKTTPFANRVPSPYLAFIRNVKISGINFQSRTGFMSHPTDIEKAIKAGRRVIVEHNGDFRTNLTETRLSGATLINARIWHADLIKTDLRSADLSKADLRGSFLYEVKLEDANLREANLGATLFASVNLSQVQNLTQSQLNRACLDDNTILPDGLVRPQPLPKSCKSAWELVWPQGWSTSYVVPGK